MFPRRRQGRIWRSCKVGQRMSNPLCYHNPMMKMKEELFKVRIATWSDGTSTWTHIKATDLEHAKRVAQVENADGFASRTLSPIR